MLAYFRIRFDVRRAGPRKEAPMQARLIDRARLLVLCSSLALGAGCGGTDRPEPEPGDPTIVVLAEASFQGTLVGDSRQFVGIPYAQAPIGVRRWAAPLKPELWPDLQPATAFGKRCAQIGSDTTQNEPSVDEDCLYLNVWTPHPIAAEPLPVMVWFHGGGNVNGSASEPVPFLNTGLFYSGQFLAEKHGVVVVTINYRLGVLGFFAHPALVAEGSSGNQGLLDQRMALQWVRDNIAGFGGDPDSVTIFGESAGAFDVCMHVASPMSRGLFHRAIGQSGGCTTRQTTKAEAEAAATNLATALSCTGADALACLRSAPVSGLLAAPGRFGPNVDGQFLPDQPRSLYNAGNVAKVPYLLGSNTDEGTLFVGGAEISTPEQYTAQLVARFGATAAAQIEQRYPVAAFTEGNANPPLAALARVVGDSSLVCSTYDTAIRAAVHAPVFMYNYDIPVPSAVGNAAFLGATHGAELTSVFGTSPLLAVDLQTKAASDLMQRYWTNFAKDGDPNAGSDPDWPQLTPTTNIRMNFAIPQSSVKTNFRADECAFWRMGYELQFLTP
jgi:para-nitrobenzyl esterase